MRPATTDDAWTLSKDMRQADADEVMASGGMTPLEAGLVSLANSDEAWALEIDGELVCLWGVAPLEDSVLARGGIVWMLTTNAIERHVKEFWAACYAVLPGLLDRWSVLINAIDVRHEKAIRWAKKLGFQLADPAPFGSQGRNFCEFRVRREDLAHV